MKIIHSLCGLSLFFLYHYNSQAQLVKKVADKTTQPPKPATSVEVTGSVPQYGEPCLSSEELQNKPGRYLTADQYPWPAVRAEYFNKLATTAEKTTAKKILTHIEKLEQQSRSGIAPAGGSWESTYSTDGYQYLNDKKFADYRLQIGFYQYICINKKVKRNGEYNTVLRVYVNNLRLNTLAKFLCPVSYGTGMLDTKYGYKDWRNHKLGVAAPAIRLFTYFECSNTDLIDVINEGKGYWQDVPEKDIRHNTFDHVYRYWFVKQSEAPVLIPVSRKEYLESLLEFYDRELMYLPESNNYRSNSPEARKNYFGDLTSVVANKKAIVQKILKENTAEWLSRQAVVKYLEDDYQNQKQKLPRYSSDFTFYRFYDSEKGARWLYKYNPGYFTAKQNMAEPELISIAFRYVPKPADLLLINNFTQKFDAGVWKKTLMPLSK